jgi:hypothetical protein
MKFLITESGLGNLVHKVLSSNKRIMPDDATIKLIKSYLDSNPDVNLGDLIGIKMGSFDFKVVRYNKQGFIYFIESEDDDVAQIAYDIDNHECWVRIGLIFLIARSFDIEFDDAKDSIGEWVSNYLNVEVTNVEYDEITTPNELKMRNYHLE